MKNKPFQIINPSMNKKILLLEGIHPKAKECFKEHGFEVQTAADSSDEKSLLKGSPFCALGIRSRTEIHPAFLEKVREHLVCIGAFCIGFNQIDIQKAAELGIAVFNSPYSNTRSVAELVIANIVNLSRKIMLFNSQVHSGQWKKTSRSSFEVRGKTLGIIGYGHIGSQAGILAESLGMKVCYFDIQKKLSLSNAKPLHSLEDLLRQSDFITLHVPQTPQTKNMITKKELAQMKKGSFLINTSRGAVVNLEDLAQFLKQKHLGGAAVDVFPEEPRSSQDVFSSDLQKLENVILTPHIAGSTEEAQIGIAQDAAESLIHYLIRGSSTGSVNMPPLNIPPLKNKSSLRITNIHQNIPGILSQINNLISNLNINVESQYLATLSNTGYLVMDIESAKTKEALKLAEQIQKLKTSMKTRIIPHL